MPRTYTRRPPEERFFAMVDANGVCWEWTGHRSRLGYGQFKPERGRCVSAHRYAWEMLIGPVPEGLELDHLCRNRGCVNPDHMEATTHSMNMRRSTHPIVLKRYQTHCKRGHELSGANVGHVKGGTQRYCRQCRKGYRKPPPSRRRFPEGFCRKGHPLKTSATNGRRWCLVCTAARKRATMTKER